MSNEIDVGGEESEEAEPEMNVQTTVTVEIPVSDVHESIIAELERAGVNVEELLAQRLQPQAEQATHDMYQQGRYAE